MNNCLILLTNYYPFHKGEEYLESEINYLSHKFKKIYVISTMVDSGMEQTRDVPSNVTVIKSGISHSFIGKLKMIFSELKGARKNIFKEQLLREDGNNHLLKRLFTLYFECRANYIYSKIKPKLDKENISIKYDQIIIYSYWLYVTARIAVELKKNYFEKFDPYTVSRAHGYDINEHVNLLKFIPQRKFLLNNLDNIYPVSQNGVNFLREKYHKYSHMVEVRRLGTKEISSVKSFDNSELKIVSCSTVRNLKRLDLIIDALEILKKRNVTFKWTHIGGGPDFNKIKKLAEQKLSSTQFEFTGHMKNDEVLEWYSKHDNTVFINTSSSEGVPVSIMEAMSMSLPVVATDVGGTKEIVESGITGYLLNSDCSKEEIANILMDIASMDKERYKKMCNSAYSLWIEKCNADKLYTDFATELSNNF